MFRTKRVLILIDQTTRDAFSQLLVAHYLRWKGARVHIANQGTLISMYERYRPQVVFASWLVGGPLMEFLEGICQKTHVVLVDQEGGKLGEMPFKRSFTREHGIKADIARKCSRVLTWGTAQAQWLRELGIMSEERIVVTGSPRLDPYLIREEPRPAATDKYLGFTLRAGAITSQPMRIMEHVFAFACSEQVGGISVGYPVRSQQEDRIWHAIAGTRYMFRIMTALARRTDARMVIRPDPWEQGSMYQFLTRHLPQVSIEPMMTQPEYVKNAFAILDESSSLGMEALLMDTPVISTQALIPNLKEHIGGEDGGLFNAPYAKAYWKPHTVDEAVEYVLKAEKGELDASPCPDQLHQYLLDHHGWPRMRPSSFQMGDAILELLDVDTASSRAFDDSSQTNTVSAFKRAMYRYVPGAVTLPKAKLFLQCVFSTDHELLKKYHYFKRFYPHHQQVFKTFRRLVERYSIGGRESVGSRPN